jgi:hypothetical protein
VNQVAAKFGETLQIAFAGFAGWFKQQLSIEKMVLYN